MRNTFKNNFMFIFILFITFVLPFRVEAKQTNTFIEDYNFDYEELISGDSLLINGATVYIPVEEQKFEFFEKDKVTNFEYYIIDSIDSNGNIKYKKYDFSNSNKSVWYPKSSTLFDVSGDSYEYSSDSVEYFNLCNLKSRNNDSDLFRYDHGGFCNVLLPAVNGRIARWRFEGTDYGDKKEIKVCSYDGHYDTLYSSCDKTENEDENTYIGTYEYYTSYVYKFYEISEEKPEVMFTCDSNKLSAGESTKCKINLSYKYRLSNILFDIISDKLKMSNLQVDDYWNADPALWTSKEIDNGYSINFTYNRRFNNFKNNPLIATFEITADEDIDDVVSSLKTTNIKYIDKTGETTISDDKTDSDNTIDNILNPSTFRNNYYLIIGIIIIGGISFIQLRSKNKNK